MNDPIVRSIFLMHLASTLFMAGLIWFVQVVHYPLYSQVGTSDFANYEQMHKTVITWVVAPPMLMELATAVLLLWFRPVGLTALPCVLGLSLVGVNLLSTLFLQVPCHEILTQAFDPAVHQKLVSTNWIRTAAWSLRGILVLWMTSFSIK